MSDRQVIAALKRFALIMHAEIEHPRTTRPGKGQGDVGNRAWYDNSLAKALLMTASEVAAWNKYYGIKKFVADEVKRGCLYVEGGLAQKDLGYRLNLEETVYDHRIHVIDSDQVEFYLLAHAYVGYHRPGHAYNAFIGMDVHAKLEGKWVLKQIEGTGIAHWDKPVYSPLYIARPSIWFNTSIKPEVPNSVTADEDQRPHDSMHHGELHDLATIDQIKVPRDPRFHFFFWQLSRLMRPRAWFTLRHAIM
jgi:hypothetical protein